MIKFYRGLKSKYTYPSSTELTDVIFFATDTHEILVNGVSYGFEREDVSDVSFDSATNTFTFTKSDGTEVVASLGDKLLTDADRTLLDNVAEMFEGSQMNITYVSKLDPNIATITALGGISAGTKVSDLTGKNISEVLDTLIFPTVQPTITAPTTSIALKSGVPNIKEVGAAAYAQTDFNLTWNPGSIKIGSNLQGNRAGNKTGEIVYAGSEANGMPTTVSEGTTNYYYKVTYAEGPAPLDSKGNPASSATALPAGSKVSGALATYGVYPYYANATSNSDFNKLNLTKENSFRIDFASENPNKHTFKLPAKYTLTKVTMLNTLSNQWENYATSNFTVTTEDIEVLGSQVSYKVYTRNDSGFNGATSFTLNISK